MGLRQRERNGSFSCMLNLRCSLHIQAEVSSKQFRYRLLEFIRDGCVGGVDVESLKAKKLDWISLG